MTQTIFSSLTQAQCDTALVSKILTRIDVHEAKLSRRRFFVGVLLFISSITATFPAFSLIRDEFIRSNFFDYLALFVSDIGTALANWQTVLFALLESLPTTAFIVMLGIPLMMLYALTLLARDFSTLQTKKLLSY